jgi:succinate dehydrogenase/fumarate reductase cytochrome b subunit
LEVLKEAEWFRNSNFFHFDYELGLGLNKLINFTNCIIKFLIFFFFLIWNPTVLQFKSTALKYKALLGDFRKWRFLFRGYSDLGFLFFLCLRVSSWDWGKLERIGRGVYNELWSSGNWAVQQLLYLYIKQQWKVVTG